MAQSDAARRRAGNELDWDGVSEELRLLGVSEERELRSRYVVLFVHLLKCIVQPERRSRSWENTIAVQRDEIALHRGPPLSKRRTAPTMFWHFVGTHNPWLAVMIFVVAIFLGSCSAPIKPSIKRSFYLCVERDNIGLLVDRIDNFSQITNIKLVHRAPEITGLTAEAQGLTGFLYNIEMLDNAHNVVTMDNIGPIPEHWTIDHWSLRRPNGTDSRPIEPPIWLSELLIVFRNSGSLHEVPPPSETEATYLTRSEALSRCKPGPP